MESLRALFGVSLDTGFVGTQGICLFFILLLRVFTCLVVVKQVVWCFFFRAAVALLVTRMFRANLRSNADDSANTPAATPGIASLAETPGTTDVNSMGDMTPSYTPMSTGQDMTPSSTPGMGYKDQTGQYDGVEESNEDNEGGDEGDEELARDDEDQENETIRNLSMSDFMPRSMSSFGKYGIAGDSMIPGMFTPQPDATPAPPSTAAAT